MRRSTGLGMRSRGTKPRKSFFHEPVLLAEDAKHSTREPRYLVLGRTAADRRLAVIFTVRRDLVRVISARPMSRKERTLYAKTPHEAP